jgi:hypothetical protein
VARQAAMEIDEPQQSELTTDAAEKSQQTELTKDAFDLNKKPGSPMVQCILNSKINSKSTVDTGSVITIVKRDLLPGPPAPPSKLRLKDVNKGTSVLYGPRVRRLLLIRFYLCIHIGTSFYLFWSVGIRIYLTGRPEQHSNYHGPREQKSICPNAF